MTDAVRMACRQTIEGLISQIPNHIEGSVEKTSPENLRWMLNRCVREIETFPIDKLNRWIGFVQGVLAMSGHLDVDKERDRTRVMFHTAYLASGQDIPKTLDKGNEDLSGCPIIDSGFTQDQDCVKTRVVGHREQRYQGEPRSIREILELVEPSSLRDIDRKNT